MNEIYCARRLAVFSLFYVSLARRWLLGKLLRRSTLIARLCDLHLLLAFLRLVDPANVITNAWGLCSAQSVGFYRRWQMSRAERDRIYKFSFRIAGRPVGAFFPIDYTESAYPFFYALLHINSFSLRKVLRKQQLDVIRDRRSGTLENDEYGISSDTNESNFY